MKVKSKNISKTNDDEFFELDESEQMQLDAEQGDSDAQFELGMGYYYGQGDVRKNYKEAAKWYLKAAKQGMPEAELEIGLMYGEGKGVRKDASRAIYWLLSAARKGQNVGQLDIELDRDYSNE